MGLVKIAFVITGPLDMSEFEMRWESNNSDFLSFVADIQAQDSLAAWDAYKNTAFKTSAAVSKIEDMGVKVFRNATLADFLSAINDFDTVVLHTHWCSSDYEAHHIIDYQSLKSKLENLITRAKGTEINYAISEIARSHGKFEFMSDSDVLFCLGKIIDICVEKTSELQDESLTRYNARERLDVLLARDVVKGNRLEFSDGMFNISEIAGRIKLKERTMVDLLVCKSYPLAVGLKRAWGSNIQFISGKQPVSMFQRTVVAYKTIEYYIKENHKNRSLRYEEVAVPLRLALARASK